MAIQINYLVGLGTYQCLITDVCSVSMVKSETNDYF